MIKNADGFTLKITKEDFIGDTAYSAEYLGLLTWNGQLTKEQVLFVLDNTNWKKLNLDLDVEGFRKTYLKNI